MLVKFNQYIGMSCVIKPWYDILKMQIKLQRKSTYTNREQKRIEVT